MGKEKTQPSKASGPSKEFKTGYCAIVGIPNVGKSTLLNTILGTKLSIMSAKPQTTRKRVLGIHSSPTEQIIFLDTPGIMPRPTTLLHKAMLDQVKQSFNDADVILVLAEATRQPEQALPEHWDHYVKAATNKAMVLALSKIDLLKDKEALLPLLQKYGEMGVFKDIVPISSPKSHNIKELLGVLHQYLPGTQPFYDPEQLSDQNERFFVSEFIREAVFKKYGEEVPYSTEVEIREFAERESGKWFINADIVVERESQKPIIIGKGGVAIKELGQRARKEIETFLDHPVFLELHVKTKSDWRNDKTALRSYGYDF
ncbi:MAG TPA: GTPase Era [Candidatus Kapabacteria bacterium]|nr:GTPase Era [Candidatus Kapabacteria bacterium]